MNSSGTICPRCRKTRISQGWARGWLSHLELNSKIGCAKHFSNWVRRSTSTSYICKQNMNQNFNHQQHESLPWPCSNPSVPPKQLHQHQLDHYKHVRDIWSPQTQLWESLQHRTDHGTLTQERIQGNLAEWLLSWLSARGSVPYYHFSIGSAKEIMRVTLTGCQPVLYPDIIPHSF